MRRKFSVVLISLLLAVGVSHAQTTTTYTGTIKRLGDVVVTSGKVQFTLKPSIDTTIAGSARFVPLVITCKITESGLKAENATDSCTVVTNTSLTPAGTYFQVDICPENKCNGRFNLFSTGGTVDISTVIPLPPTVSAYPYATFAGVNTWTGTNTFNATTTFGDAIHLEDGNSEVPSIAWQTEPNTGFYRLGSGIVKLSLGGTDAISFTGTGINTQYFTGTLIGDVQGSVTANGYVTTPTLTVGGGSAMTWYTRATHASLDLASVAISACSAAQSENVVGAALGDTCTVSSGTVAADNSFYICNVTAPNTVKWSYCNFSASPQDRGADTYTIRVMR